MIALTIIVILALGVYYLLFTHPEQQTAVAPTATTTVQLIKIGVLLPLNGDQAAGGEAALAGAQLAAQEINQGGGVNGSQMRVVAEDDSCSKDGGVSAMTRLIVVEQVTAIIGPACAAAADAASPVAQVAGVPTLLLSSAAANATAVGDFIFRIYPADRTQAVLAAEYVSKKLKKNRVAVIVAEQDGFRFLAETFVSSFKELNGIVVENAAVAATISVKEARALVTKFKKGKVDILYGAAPAEILSIFSQEARASKTPFVIIGAQSWDGSVRLMAGNSGAPPAVTGVTYINPKIAVPDEFRSRLKEGIGKEATPFAAVIYDAVKLLAETMKNSGADKKTLRNNLLPLSYEGGVALPKIQFDERRDLRGALFSLESASGTLVSVEDFDLGDGGGNATSTAPL